MITLRSDQDETVHRVRIALKTHQAVILRAPCGSGKTVMASFMVAGAHHRKRRAIFAVHRRELARQTATTFDQFGIPYGYIMAGMPLNPFAAVQVASRDTLRNRPELASCDLFIADEGHLWSSGSGAELIDTARKAGAKIVILTATPARGDGKPMARIADAIVSGMSEGELIKMGSLARYRAIAPARPDLSKLHTRAGEYVQSEVDELMGRPAVVADAVKFYQQFASGKRHIGFAPSRARGAEYAEQFRAAGIGAEFIDGETPDDERRRVITMFADGQIKVLMNCQLFMEGFDLSAQVGRNVPIQSVGLYNPTKSLPRAIQMMMRPMRPQDGEAIILDHACIMVNRDGTVNHGFPDDEREWSLEGVKSRSGSGEGTIPTVTCSQCFGVFRPAAACPYCGAVRETYGREVEEFEAQMEALDPERIRLEQIELARQKEFKRRAEKIEEREAGSDLRKWEALAAKRGFNRGWAFHRCAAVRNKANA